MNKKLDNIKDNKYTQFLWLVVFSMCMLVLFATFAYTVYSFKPYVKYFGLVDSIFTLVVFYELSVCAAIITLCLWLVNLFAKKLSPTSVIGIFACNIATVAMPFFLMHFNASHVLYYYAGYIFFAIPLALAFIARDLVNYCEKSVTYQIVFSAFIAVISITNMVYIVISPFDISSALFTIGVTPVFSLATILLCFLQKRFDIISKFAVIRHFVTLALYCFMCSMRGIGGWARIVLCVVLAINTGMLIYEMIKVVKSNKKGKENA